MAPREAKWRAAQVVACCTSATKKPLSAYGNQKTFIGITTVGASPPHGGHVAAGWRMILAAACCGDVAIAIPGGGCLVTCRGASLIRNSAPKEADIRPVPRALW